MVTKTLKFILMGLGCFWLLAAFTRCGGPDQFGTPNGSSSSTSTDTAGSAGSTSGSTFDCPPVTVEGLPLVCFPATEQETITKVLKFMAQDTTVYPRGVENSLAFLKKDNRLAGGIVWVLGAKSAPTIPDQALAVYYPSRKAMYIKPTMNNFSIFMLASVLVHEAAHFDIQSHSCGLFADQDESGVYGINIHWLAHFSVTTDKLHCFDRAAHYQSAQVMDQNRICGEPRVNVAQHYAQPVCTGSGSGSTGPTAGAGISFVETPDNQTIVVTTDENGKQHYLKYQP